MKKILIMIIAATTVLVACNNDKKEASENTDSMNYSSEDMLVVEKPVVKPGKYVNLVSGEEVEIIADPTTGIAVNSKTQMPVEFYYDPITMDTLYQNGLRVNNMLINLGDGKYKLDDMKIKIDGDEIKIKTDSSKIKIDSNTYKMKAGDEKTKITDDKVKMKDESGKVKITEDGTKIKPNN